MDKEFLDLTLEEKHSLENGLPNLLREKTEIYEQPNKKIGQKASMIIREALGNIRIKGFDK